MSEKSPFFVDAKPLTRLDILRELMDRLESDIGRLEKVGLGAQALEIPELLDKSLAALEELEQSGIPVREEAARFLTIGAQFKEKAAVFMRAIGGAPTLQRARQARNPGPERWWWFLDQWLAQRKRGEFLQFARKAGIVVVILVVLGILYQVFLAPSAEEGARFSHEGAADRYLMEGNLEAALVEIENALAIFPEDGELLVLKGVILQSLEREAEAGQVYAQAEAALGDRKQFLLLRGQDYLATGNYEASIQDAQAVLELDPEAPEAYLLLGQANELLGNYQEAITAYEKAGELANAQNRPDLTALARVRLAYLMQRMP